MIIQLTSFLYNFLNQLRFLNQIYCQLSNFNTQKILGFYSIFYISITFISLPLQNFLCTSFIYFNSLISSSLSVSNLLSHTSFNTSLNILLQSNHLLHYRQILSKFHQNYTLSRQFSTLSMSIKAFLLISIKQRSQ